MKERIVVGFDGSDGGERALRWALLEGESKSATVEVVYALPHSAFVAGYPPLPVGSEAIEAAKQAASEMVEEQVAKTGARERGVAVEISISDYSPSPALLDAAKGADLVVVGSRGRGGFTGLLLGSVSQQVVNHAPCPVVVIPPLDR